MAIHARARPSHRLARTFSYPIAKREENSLGKIQHARFTPNRETDVFEHEKKVNQRADACTCGDASLSKSSSIFDCPRLISCWRSHSSCRSHGWLFLGICFHDSNLFLSAHTVELPAKILLSAWMMGKGCEEHQ